MTCEIKAVRVLPTGAKEECVLRVNINDETGWISVIESPSFEEAIKRIVDTLPGVVNITYEFKDDWMDNPALFLTYVMSDSLLNPELKDTKHYYSELFRVYGQAQHLASEAAHTYHPGLYPFSNVIPESEWKLQQKKKETNSISESSEPGK